MRAAAADRARRASEQDSGSNYPALQRLMRSYKTVYRGTQNASSRHLADLWRQAVASLEPSSCAQHKVTPGPHSAIL